MAWCLVKHRDNFNITAAATTTTAAAAAAAAAWGKNLLLN
jgi:hypothetical protein